MSRRPARCTEAPDCSFCGVNGREEQLIAGPPPAYCCERCAVLLYEIVIERNAYGPPMARSFKAPDAENPKPMVLPRPPKPKAPPPDCSGMPPLPAWPPKGFVYFLHARMSQRIKIGFSVNPSGRVHGIMTSCPEKLDYLGAVPGTVNDERALHEAFADIRVHREWFTATPELMAYIDEATA